METFLKEKEVIYDEGHRGSDKVRGRADAGLALGIVGTVLGGAALLGRGGIGAILGNGGGAPVTVNAGGGCSTFNAYAKECDDVLALTNTIYGLKIGTMQAAQAARDVDVAEKFGLYKDNRDNLDAVNARINNELFSLYKYTRDKDDETNAKINEIASAVAVNTAVRPYQDKLIQCKIDEVYTALVNYVDRKTCRMISGRLVLPSTPTITGYSADCACEGTTAAAGA